MGRLFLSSKLFVHIPCRNSFGFFFPSGGSPPSVFIFLRPVKVVWTLPSLKNDMYFLLLVDRIASFFSPEGSPPTYVIARWIFFPQEGSLPTYISQGATFSFPNFQGEFVLRILPFFRVFTPCMSEGPEDSPSGDLGPLPREARPSGDLTFPHSPHTTVKLPHPPPSSTCCLLPPYPLPIPPPKSTVSLDVKT